MAFRGGSGLELLGDIVERIAAAADAVAGSPPIVSATVGRSRAFVQRWAYALRDGGLADHGIADDPRRSTPGDEV